MSVVGMLELYTDNLKILSIKQLRYPLVGLKILSMKSLSVFVFWQVFDNLALFVLTTID